MAIDSVRAEASSFVISKVVVTYTDDSRFTVTSDSTYAPPLMDKSETHTTMDAHWVSTCPFGMSPGDMIGSTGLQARYFPKSARAPAQS